MTKHIDVLLEVLGQPVVSEANGRDRHDGYDVQIYRGDRRWIVIVGTPRRWTGVYVAPTLEDAERLIRPGYTPGAGPGMGAWIPDASRLREVRGSR